MADNSTLDTWSGTICNFLKVHWRAVFTIVWPVFCLICFCLGFEQKFRCMYILLVMAGYWVTESLPLAVTGLLPMFLCPLLKVVPAKPIATQYMNATNALFIVGLMLAIAIENCNLHFRIALCSMLALGCSPRKLHFGLSFITMFLSMWLINSACCAMMCPIIMAILKELELQGIITIYEPVDPAAPVTDAPPKLSKICLGFFFAAPIFANLGGTGTLVGTPANLSYKGQYELTYPWGHTIDFVPWMLYNIPPLLLIAFLSWLSLQISCMGMFQPNSKEYLSCKLGAERKDAIRQVIKNRMTDLGPMSFSEKVVGFLFLTVVIGWLTRSPQVFKGWGDLYKKGYIADCAYPFLPVILMFLIPASCTCVNFCTKDRSKRPAKPSPGVITWPVFHQKFPWGLIFLIGGGFAISHAGKESGLSDYLGEKLTCFKPLPAFLVLCICTAIASITTELTSNVVVCQILMPVLFTMSKALDVHPVYFSFPTTLCCSHSFIMPMGTPTNAIALAYAGIPTSELVKHATATKIIAWVITTLMFPLYGMCFYDMTHAPEWLYWVVSTTVKATTTVLGGVLTTSSGGVVTAGNEPITELTTLEDIVLETDAP